MPHRKAPFCKIGKTANCFFHSCGRSCHPKRTETRDSSGPGATMPRMPLLQTGKQAKRPRGVSGSAKHPDRPSDPVGIRPCTGSRHQPDRRTRLNHREVAATGYGGKSGSRSASLVLPQDSKPHIPGLKFFNLVNSIYQIQFGIPAKVTFNFLKRTKDFSRRKIGI